MHAIPSAYHFLNLSLAQVVQSPLHMTNLSANALSGQS